MTTSQVTDATPAAFGAHVADRAEQSEIARQYIEYTKLDVILGGGEDFWFPAGNPGGWPDNPPKDPTEQSKGTQGNLSNRRKQAGYQYVHRRRRLNADPLGQGPRLCSPTRRCSSIATRARATSTSPPCRCKDMSTKALGLLSRDRDGFFLLIEEEGIDEMSHHGNAELTIKSGAGA